MQTFETQEKENVTKNINVSHKSLSKKVSQSLLIIKEAIEMSKNPVVFVSFGKDSLVMMHLIFQIKKCPCVYLREPYFQSKFKHAQDVAEKYDLTVFDYPPSLVDYIQLEDYFEVFNYYYINGRDFYQLYTGTRNYTEKDKKYLCAIHDLILRPRVPAYEFKFDCIFNGQKQSDPIYISEKKPFLSKIKIFGNGIISYPLKDWEDEDIWAYIKENNLPYNKDRYDSQDESRNNDLYPTCHDCLDYRKNSQTILCKKFKKQVLVACKTKEQNENFRDKILERQI